MPRCKRPCPGCGEPDRYRDADKVCSDCRQKIDAQNELQARSEKRLGRGKRIFELPSAAYQLRYLHHSYTNHSEDHGRLFQQHFHRLVQEIGEERLWSAEIDEQGVSVTGQDGSWDRTFWELPAAAAEHLIGLYESAERMLECGYLNGRNDGANLLTRLAEGDVTIEHFNEAVLRTEAEMRKKMIPEPPPPPPKKKRAKRG